MVSPPVVTGQPGNDEPSSACQANTWFVAARW